MALATTSSGKVENAPKRRLKTGARPRVGILVCGMHRCGTSALTRVLSLLGAALPADVYPAGPGNELGHWEPSDAGPLHDEMLASMGTHWASLVPASEHWLESEAATHYRHDIKELLSKQFGDAPLFVLKDPRLSLFLPMWLDVMAELSIEPRIVVATRNPLEVAQSLGRRHSSADSDWAWHSDRGGMLWLKYMLAAERNSRGTVRAFYDYADILSGWRTTAARLGSQLGVTWPTWSASTENQIDRFISGEMRHHEAHVSLSGMGPIWKDWIEPIYDDLAKARAEQDVDRKKFGRIEAALSDSLGRFGHYLAAVEAGQAASSSAVAKDETLPSQEAGPAAPEANSSQQLTAELECERQLEQFKTALQHSTERLESAEARAVALSAELGAAEARADAIAKQLLVANTYKAALATETALVQNLEVEIRQLQQRLRQTDVSLDVTHAKDTAPGDDQLRAELAMLRAQNRELTRLANQMRYSFSWRLTRPIRVLRGRFPGIAGAAHAILRRARQLVRHPD